MVLRVAEKKHSGTVLRIRCLFDPESGAFLPLDPGWGKNQDPCPGSGSGMNHPDHISERLETILLKFFDADPGWKKFRFGIQEKHPGIAAGTKHILSFFQIITILFITYLPISQNKL
jgi:hypothetical protein